MRKGGVFISWETHTRSRTISKKLNVRLFEIVVPGNLFKRYLVSTFKTCFIIRRSDPSVIIIQNPSIVLALITLLFFSRNRKIVMDAHNSAVYPMEGRNKFLNGFAQFLLRQSDLVIVTNHALYDTLFTLGAKPFVLSDPIPTPPIGNRKIIDINPEIPEVVFICTWAPDEPYLEFLGAAKLLENESISIKVTGRPPEIIKNKSMPSNLKLMGFVSDRDYWELLTNAAVVVDLTTRENCLVCGAYEAAAVGAPCVVSNTLATRETFTSGYVCVENKANDIAEGILFALVNQRELRNAVADFKASYTSIIRQKVDELSGELGI
ncbi:glycosyltransferase [Marinobacter halotolerans]|uniref:glycosyltransferase n=1 Tax=Marinobacter halotolerans TaxID=1569211 RepID=UPI0012468E17|nr:glycosyltransferase [Marinobacter halotolerans]